MANKITLEPGDVVELANGKIYQVSFIKQNTKYKNRFIVRLERQFEEGLTLYVRKKVSLTTALRRIRRDPFYGASRIQI